MLRPFVESSEICVPLTRELCSPVSAWIEAALDSTVTTSAIVPNSMWKSTRIRSFTFRTTPLNCSTLKPEDSAFKSYLPMGRPGATYWPTPLVISVRLASVCALVIVTVTFAIAPLFGSVIVPTIVASWAVTRDGNATSNPTMKTVRLSQRCFTMRTVQTNDENEEHIVPPHKPDHFQDTKKLVRKHLN